MKRILFSVSVAALLLASCDGHPEAAHDVKDTAAIPDSVPQVVRLGKEADWAYKPDTMIDDLLLGDALSWKAFKVNNGDEGVTADHLTSAVYVNTRETEQLWVYLVNTKKGAVPYGFRVKRNIRDKNSPAASNYGMAPNFITSAGIYIGMSQEYVQTIYKSQPMMRWVKSDTTYLGYSPSEKDKEHYKRFSIDDYQASYKFVNDQCVVMEVMIDPDAFEKE